MALSSPTQELFVAPESYSISDTQIEEIEGKLAEVIAARTQASLGALVLASPDPEGYFGALGRRLEVRDGKFYEMPEEMKDAEAESTFIYMFDAEALAQDRLRVTHVTRFLQPSQDNAWKLPSELAEELDADLEEISEYHNIDRLEDCLYLTTDLAVADIMPTRFKPYGLLAYRAFMEYGTDHGYEHVFAYMNPKTIRGLGRLGITPVTLCGRSDYDIPPIGGISFEQYQPYVLSSSQGHQAFTDPEFARRTRWGEVVMNTSVELLEVEES
ncbi:MAG TPA: hypothetical protein VLF60_02230 [Candidatus Saccharimonadales bacterium]|nr:hypothetical protein [Candidatus Saccharimonadales bacterium]